MSLKLTEARSRAAALSGVSYDVHLDLTDPGSGSFGCRTTVRFASSAPKTFLELSHATELAVIVNGAVADPAYDARRIQLSDLTQHNEVVVTARLPYVTDGDGMHIFTDPADGETYVSAYVGMDVAQRVFACFDQNDLKAPVTLTVTADARWTVLANGREVEAGGGRWAFASTPPIPVAMFVVCAGPWHSVRWEHAGLPFGWHARRSLAAELDRDAEELMATTVDCFDHYATLFSEPYAFDSFDQAFVPGQNWGALESPGCVTYRDEYLPRGRITQQQRRERATTIAHEMAHMWFGNLVTMTWWEDTWLQESFADYMGYRVAHDGAGFDGTQVLCEIGRKPTAYDADQRRSTHPIAPDAEDVADVDAAANNFDMISYAKGNAAIRQLVTWLGDETFLAGVNAYLSRHRLGNATLGDFMTALDEASDRDVLAWADVWLRRSGFDSIRVTRQGTVPVLTRSGSRPHRLRVTAYDDELAELGSRLVDLGDDMVRLEGWADAVVIANSHGETYARIEPDDHSWRAVRAGLSRIEDDLVRAVVWAGTFDLVRTRVLTAADFLDLLERHLPTERHVATLSGVLDRALGVVIAKRLPAEKAAAAVDRVAASCSAGLDLTDDEELRVAWSAGLARTTRDAGMLHRWLDEDRTDDGLTLDPALRWRAIHRLAEIGAADAGLIEAERTRDGTVEGELGAATALAARPSAEAKAETWAAVVDDDRLSNRMLSALTSGLWSLEQAELVAPYVDLYLAEGPRLAGRGQAFAQEVARAFPRLALDAAQVAAFETALEGDLPSVLRRGWEDRLDDLR